MPRKRTSDLNQVCGYLLSPKAGEDPAAALLLARLALLDAREQMDTRVSGFCVEFLMPLEAALESSSDDGQ